MPFIKCSIKLSDVDKARFYVSPTTGEKYLNFVVYENEQPGKFGHTHTLKEDNSQEERAENRKAKIIGNGKEIGGKPKAAAPVSQRPPVAPMKPADPDLDAPDGDDSGIPF